MHWSRDSSASGRQDCKVLSGSGFAGRAERQVLRAFRLRCSPQAVRRSPRLAVADLLGMSAIAATLRGSPHSHVAFAEHHCACERPFLLRRKESAENPTLLRVKAICGTAAPIQFSVSRGRLSVSLRCFPPERH